MKSFNIDIIEIGSYPPPFGGISIHIKRLIEYLNIKNVSYRLYIHMNFNNPKNDKIIKIKNPYIFYFLFYFIHKCKIVHYHDPDWRKRFLLALLKPNNIKLFFTFHSFNYNIEKVNLFRRFIWKIVYKRADKIIAVSDEVKDKLLLTGCDSKIIEKIPAIIYPTIDYIQNITNKEELKVIYNVANNHKIIIVANSSNNKHFNGQDLYGIDMCIELLQRLRKKINVGLLFFISWISDLQYYKDLISTIKRLDLDKHFIFLTSQEELIKYINCLSKYNEIFLRPTNADGDAISVREALYCKIPTIASDVVKRPEGTIVFKNRDINDLYDKTIKMIENYSDYKSRLNNIKIEDNAEKVFNLYMRSVCI